MFDSSSPIYLQLARQIEDQIVAGELVAGQQVMSTTQYALKLQINPATVAKAFSLLVAKELLEKRRGLGMFVTSAAHHALLQQRKTDFFANVLHSTLEQAKLLGISTSEIVAFITKAEPNLGPESEEVS